MTELSFTKALFLVGSTFLATGCTQCNQQGTTETPVNSAPPSGAIEAVETPAGDPAAASSPADMGSGALTPAMEEPSPLPSP